VALVARLLFTLRDAGDRVGQLRHVPRALAPPSVGGRHCRFELSISPPPASAPCGPGEVARDVSTSTSVNRPGRHIDALSGAAGWETPSHRRLSGGDKSPRPRCNFTPRRTRTSARRRSALVDQFPQIHGPAAAFLRLPDPPTPGLVGRRPRATGSPDPAGGTTSRPPSFDRSVRPVRVPCGPPPRVPVARSFARCPAHPAALRVRAPGPCSRPPSRPLPPTTSHLERSRALRFPAPTPSCSTPSSKRARLGHWPPAHPARPWCWHRLRRQQGSVADDEPATWRGSAFVCSLLRARVRGRSKTRQIGWTTPVSRLPTLHPPRTGSATEGRSLQDGRGDPRVGVARGLLLRAAVAARAAPTTGSTRSPPDPLDPLHHGAVPLPTERSTARKRAPATKPQTTAPRLQALWPVCLFGRRRALPIGQGNLGRSRLRTDHGTRPPARPRRAWNPPLPIIAASWPVFLPTSAPR